MNVRTRRSARPSGPGGKGPGRHSFREEIVKLHREIFRRNKRRIDESVCGYTDAFKRYERAYSNHVRTFQQRATLDELDRAVGRANVVYVGDYHTLPQAQKSFLQILQRAPPTRPVTVALEFFQGRHQSIVDAFVAGTLSEEALLNAIQYETHWMYGAWWACKQVLDLARQRGYQVIGIDSAGHGPAGSTLHTRDRYAARRIERALRSEPDRLAAVLVGELHIAPCHLPAEVRALMTARDRDIADVVVYQNCEHIYWALEERGLEHEVDLVRIAKHQYCMVNTLPIVCQQSFLNWLELDEDAGHLEAPQQSFKEYARLIASFFELPIGDALDEVEIYTVADLSFLARLRQRSDFSDSDIRQIRRQILMSESYYIPRAKMVYLGNLSVNHASEEATHFLRHISGRHASEPKLLIDAFYARCLEEALGFLGSKVINHKRTCPSPQFFERSLRSRTSTAREKKLASLVLKHTRMEEGKPARGMAEVYECDADMFNAVTHVIGYRIGNKLYYALLDGHIDKEEIREMFFDSFEEEGSALASFLYVNTRLLDVNVPE